MAEQPLDDTNVGVDPIASGSCDGGVVALLDRLSGACDFSHGSKNHHQVSNMSEARLDLIQMLERTWVKLFDLSRSLSSNEFV